MKQTDAFPGRFLKAADLNGRKLTLTIKAVRLEEVGDDPSRVVVYFKEEDRGLVLNKTNFSAIEEFTGQDDTDNWAGHRLVLGAVKVEFQGKRVLGLRVIEGMPKDDGPTLQDDGPDRDDVLLTDEDIPF